MKHTTTTIILLAGASNALPQFSLPSFSLPTGTGGSGTGLGEGSGTGFPSFPSGGGSGFPSLPSGGGSGSGFPSLSSGGRSGSGFASIPSSGGSSTGSSWKDLFSGFGGGSGSGTGTGTGTGTPTTPSTPTQTGVATAPSQTGSTGGNTGGAGNIGANCTPQSGGRGSSENGVTDKNCCTDMTVIFARGTGETGNVGTVSGPPMFRALREKLGNERVTVQGVDYPASAGGNANMGADGGAKMAQLVSAALSQCADTKVIVSGYSQGGMVVHNAFRNGLSSSQVAGAVLFGDPLKRQAVGDLDAAKVKQFCGTSDQICGGGGDGGATGGHISYGSSAGAAADFAIQVAGLA